MTKQHLNVPEPGVREIAHGMAFKIARDKLAELADIEGQCRKSGAQRADDGKTVGLRHLERKYTISIPDGEVTFADSSEAVPLRDKILILHYFTRATGAPLTGRMITYKEVPDGINYYPTFFKRTIEPFLNRYKDEPEKLVMAGKRLGGEKADYGDAAVTLPAFPRVPLTLVLWRGDSEFPPDGSIMFDSTIGEYLPTEDITILCEVIAWRLARL